MELEMAVADEEFGIVGSLSGEVLAESVATLRSEAEANNNRKWDHIQTTRRHQTWYLYLGQATQGISDCISLHPSFKRLRQFDTFREIVIQYGSKDRNFGPSGHGRRHSQPRGKSSTRPVPCLGTTMAKLSQSTAGLHRARMRSVSQVVFTSRINGNGPRQGASCSPQTV